MSETKRESCAEHIRAGSWCEDYLLPEDTVEVPITLTMCKDASKGNLAMTMEGATFSDPETGEHLGSIRPNVAGPQMIVSLSDKRGGAYYVVDLTPVIQHLLDTIPDTYEKRGEDDDG